MSRCLMSPSIRRRGVSKTRTDRHAATLCRTARQRCHAGQRDRRVAPDCHFCHAGQRRRKPSILTRRRKSGFRRRDQTRRLHRRRCRHPLCPAACLVLSEWTLDAIPTMPDDTPCPAAHAGRTPDGDGQEIIKKCTIPCRPHPSPTSIPGLGKREPIWGRLRYERRAIAE